MLRSRDAVVFGPPVPSLVHWGRSPDADLAYRALVLLGPGTTTELRLSPQPIRHLEPDSRDCARSGVSGPTRRAEVRRDGRRE
jgi:hypothetical protein